MPQSVEELLKVNGDQRKQLEEEVIVIAQRDKVFEEQGKQLEEKRKVIEEKDEQLEDEQKEIEWLRKENQALARRIKELEAQPSKQ